MMTYVWVNIGSGNVLLSDGTEPLPVPKLFYKSTRGTSAIDRLDNFENYLTKIVFWSLKGNGLISYKIYKQM